MTSRSPAVRHQTERPGICLRRQHAVRRGMGFGGIQELLTLGGKSFGIGVTIIEPVAIRTGFARALDFSAPLRDYCDGPVDEFRQKVASIIVDVTPLPAPPLRLALDNDPYTAIDTALHERLRDLSRYRELSGSIAYAA